MVELTIFISVIGFIGIAAGSIVIYRNRKVFLKKNEPVI
jgi:hypothetical protein